MATLTLSPRIALVEPKALVASGKTAPDPAVPRLCVVHGTTF
jgi:hypothetical protein